MSTCAVVRRSKKNGYLVKRWKTIDLDAARQASAVLLLLLLLIRLTSSLLRIAVAFGSRKNLLFAGLPFWRVLLAIIDRTAK